MVVEEYIHSLLEEVKEVVEPIFVRWDRRVCPILTRKSEFAVFEPRDRRLRVVHCVLDPM